MKTKLTGKDLAAMGFKSVSGDVEAYRRGPNHAVLYIVRGYEDSGWWAMVAKYPLGSLEELSGRWAHFDRRLYKIADVVRLIKAIYA